MAKTLIITFIITLLVVFVIALYYELQTTKQALSHHEFLVDQLLSTKQVPNSSDSIDKEYERIKHLKKLSDKKLADKKLAELYDLNESPSWLYVFGGVGDKNVELFSASKWDGTSGWTRISDMPNTRVEACGAVVDNKIYMFGGLRNKGAVDDSIVYNIAYDTYTPLPAMPKQRASCAAAVLGEYIYIAGGSLPPGEVETDSVIRYHIETQEWSNVRPMHRARMNHQLVELNGLLYAIGGKTSSSTVEVYNPAADQWSPIEDPLNKKYFPGAVAYGGKIYAIGYGFEMYTPENRRWRDLDFANSNFTINLHTLAYMKGKLWTLGGIFTDVNDQNSKKVFSYNLTTTRWFREKDIDVGRRFHSVFAVNP